MQITLIQEEIESAIDSFVRNALGLNNTQTMTVDLKAGRGEHGYTAMIDIALVTPHTNHDVDVESVTVQDEDDSGEQDAPEPVAKSVFDQKSEKPTKATKTAKPPTTSNPSKLGNTPTPDKEPEADADQPAVAGPIESEVEITSDTDGGDAQEGEESGPPKPSIFNFSKPAAAG